jgi:hypothetical protein
MPNKDYIGRPARDRRYVESLRLPGDPPSAYGKRDQVLFRMGFASYCDYLRSPAWKAIREAKIAIDPRCEICGDKSQQVHHLAYNRQVLSGRDPRKLMCVCAGCHRRIEFTAKGKKRTFAASLRTAKRLLISVGRWEEHKKPQQAKRQSTDAAYERPPKAVTAAELKNCDKLATIHGRVAGQTVEQPTSQAAFPHTLRESLSIDNQCAPSAPLTAIAQREASI